MHGSTRNKIFFSIVVIIGFLVLPSSVMANSLSDEVIRPDFRLLPSHYAWSYSLLEGQKKTSYPLRLEESSHQMFIFYDKPNAISTLLNYNYPWYLSLPSVMLAFLIDIAQFQLVLFVENDLIFPGKYQVPNTTYRKVSSLMPLVLDETYCLALRTTF